MKITFIDPTESVINYGLRSLSQYLMQAGHSVEMIFLNQSSILYNYEYSKNFYEDLYKIVKDSDLIGISLVSNYLGHAISITQKLKDRFNIPVIWGGIHATATPRKSLDFTDLVCVGEGEACMLSLLETMKNGKDYQDVPNLWYKNDGKIICNETAPVDPNIDDYSIPLYDNSREFIRQADNIVPMDDNIRKQITGVPTNYYSIQEKTTYPYLTLTSRGCPNSCTYCCNNLFKKIYKGKGTLLRHRSNKSIIDELKTIILQMPFINIIEFFDDDFIYKDEKTISEFTSLYKRDIGLPFRCNFRPESVTYNKLSLLYNAGLISIEMGLQSASPRINKLFKRHFDESTFLDAVYIINKFDKIIPHYDIITDNPFENYDDIQQTLRFISRIPQPYIITVFSLTFFPGTQIYEEAQKNKMINNEIKEIINKKDNINYEYTQPYIKLMLLYIRKADFKSSVTCAVFNALTSKFALIVFDSFLLYPLWFTILFTKRVLKKIKNAEVRLFPG